MVNHRFLGALLAVSLVLSSCGDDDDGPTTAGPVDTTPPAISSITPVDVNHIDLTFSEEVGRASAEDSDNYFIIETTRFVSATAPDDTLQVAAVVLKADGRTASITTAAMNAAPYNVTITGIEDMSGNAIATPVVASFAGTIDPDVTPPEIVYRSPAPNETNAGVSTAMFVQFSEFVSASSVADGLSLMYGSEELTLTVWTSDDLLFHIVPTSPLELAHQYTLGVSGVADDAGNIMPDETWSFRTTGQADETPPTIVASTPADLAVNVDVNSDLSFTFSEPMDETELIIDKSPYFYLTDGVWSNGGRTWSAELAAPLEDDQQYTITVVPTYARDLAGNQLDPVPIRFTTGLALERGGIAGRVFGDDQSDYVNDPTGTLVFAEHEDFETGGWNRVASNDAYDISYLTDGTYFLYAVLEANGNPNDLDPDRGDAFGFFGVDLANGDYDEDVVVVSGARVTGRNFPLVDISAINGAVYYSGIYEEEYHEVAVGLFDVDSFDPQSPDYYAYVEYDNLEYMPFTAVSYFDMPAEGTFYVGAFIDANDNYVYDEGVDPVGFYGDDSPIALDVKNGSDFNVVGFSIVDPEPAAKATASVSSWPIRHKTRHELLSRLSKATKAASTTKAP